MKTRVTFLLLTVLLVSSCSDDLIEDFIAGTWEMKTYLRNDVNETSEIKISSYEETYIMDETFSRKYIDGKQALVEETGTFSINEDESTIHISDVSSIADFSDSHSTLSTSTINVTTIDDTEFVYSFENGGDNHEFRFMKKE